MLPHCVAASRFPSSKNITKRYDVNDLQFQCLKKLSIIGTFPI